MLAELPLTHTLPSRDVGSVRILIGLAAISLALEPLRQGGSLLLLLASAFLLVCSATDTFLGEIPNPLNLMALLAGVAYHTSAATGGGLLFCCLGVIVGGGLLLVPYLLGGMGAGDVKALAALGALLGPGAVFQTFLYAGLVGGVLALLYIASGVLSALGSAPWYSALAKRGARTARFPYATAFTFGYVAYLTWGGLL